MNDTIDPAFLVFDIGFIIFVLIAIKSVIRIKTIVHRHKLDPCDIKRIADDRVDWVCWECGVVLTAYCGLDILSGNTVEKRPERSGSLWGSSE